MHRPESKWNVYLIVLTILGLLGSGFGPQTAPDAAAQAGMPTSKVAEGIYYVYATREGLVGGWTSSGHQIVENDFFVALPSCTPQSCPRGATRGNMTNCGSRCYVKVVNPVTNLCRVEPIKDIGPWFTVDDWWNPTETRHLNSLSTNPQILPQGYTGADAARNGLNVGYGIASNGIGMDNTHQLANRGPRAVGNRAAIDLADGTWRNLKLTSPDTIGSRIYVHMLWQTGGDPAAEAQACGHQLNQRGGTMYPLPVPSTTPLPYPPATSTVTVTPVSGGQAQVVNTGGAGLRCRTGPSTGAGIITTLAQGSRVAVRGLPVAGWLPISCNGQEGWASTDYLSYTLPTPTPTSAASPTSTTEASPTAPASPTEPEGSPDAGSPTATIEDGSPAATPTSAPPTETPPATPTATTPPTPTSTPNPEGRAVVSGTGGLGLRCRTGPSTGASQIGNLAEGLTVTLRGPATAGWYPVTCGGQEGWASASYLRVTVTPDTPASPTPTATPPTTPTATSMVTPTGTATATVTPTTTSTTSATASATPVSTGSARVVGTGGLGLRCRTAPSTAGSQITTLLEGTTVRVTGQAIAGWHPVRCAGQDGWASGSYLQITSAPSTATTTPTTPGASPTATNQPAITGTVANTGGANVRCRVGPSTSTGIIVNLPEGATVVVRGAQQNSWYPVQCSGRDGFIHADYLNVGPAAVARQAMVEQDAATETSPSLEPTAPSEVQTQPTDVVIETATAVETPTVVEPVLGSGWIASDNGEAINCRAEPSTDAAILTTLNHGTWIETRGKPMEGWQQVGCAGTWGYVASQFVSATEPAPIVVVAAEESGSGDSEAQTVVEESAPALPAGSNPIFPVSLLPVSGAIDSNGESAWAATDRSNDSVWSGTRLTIDLGTSSQVTGVRWLTAPTDVPSEITVLASQDGESWWTVGAWSPRQPWTWEGAWVESTARFIRLQSPAWFSVAEVEVWGSPAEAKTSGPHMANAALLPGQASRNHVAAARIGGTIADDRRRHRSNVGSTRAAICRNSARRRDARWLHREARQDVQAYRRPSGRFRPGK